VTLEKLDAIEGRAELLYEAQRARAREHIPDHLCAEWEIPVKTGPIWFVNDKICMRREQVAARFERVNDLPGDRTQPVHFPNKIKHFAAHDQIKLSGKWILCQIEPYESNVCHVGAAVCSPVESNVRNIRADERIDAGSELRCEVAFCTPKLEGPPDTGRRKQIESLLVLCLLVGAGIPPRIGLGRKERLKKAPAVHDSARCLRRS
jgi:hypothetical protein